jgi:hypothetical protein
MDLLDLLRNQIRGLPQGSHERGLRSVLQHIEAAYKHFARGQDGDDTAYTDTIHRTNMAFEGSIKEAYRVLADKDPTKLRPFDIEQYLEKHNIFSERVLAQFTSYRTQWRNPSSHDYILDFDEAEAFLAIVYISAFTKLLVDEIAERLSYDAVKSEVAHHEGLPSPSPSQSFVSQVIETLLAFPQYYGLLVTSPPIESEAQLLGALSAYLTARLPAARTSTGRIIRAHRNYYVDIMVELGSDVVLIELKRGDSPSLVDRGVSQLLDYLAAEKALIAASARYGILFLYSQKSTSYRVDTLKGIHTGAEIHVIRPTLAQSITWSTD